MAKKDLTRLKEDAEKLFRKGKLDKALDNYQELEKLSKGDVRFSQKIAETLAKMEKKPEATAKYNECIDKYLEKGFLVQAIALAKVILELDPEDKEAKRKLEELAEKRQSAGMPFKKPKKEEPAPAPSEPEEPGPAEAPVEEQAAKAPEMNYGMIELDSDQEAAEEPQEEAEDFPLEADEAALPEEGPVHTLLFSDLKPDEFSRVFDTLRSVTIPPGIAICREGDQGDSIFVIAEGEVKVFRKDQDDKEIYLADLGPGDFFGEFGYFANSIRQATVKAENKVQLLEISREDMDRVIEEFPRVKEVMLKFYKERVLDNILAMSSLFQGMGQNERLKMIEQFELKEIGPGEVIVKEGETGESMFLIKSGRVEVTTINPIDKSRTVLATLESGEFFGEVSLIKEKPRTASVTALTPLEMMVITRERFQQIAEEHPDIKTMLERTIEQRVEDTIEKVTKKPRAVV